MSDDRTLTPERLERFLARRLPDATSIAVSDVAPLSGGYSCVTTRFTATIDGTPRTLLARADAPAGQAVLESDRMQEWAILSALTEHGGVPMPDALFADEDGSELGARTIVLDYADGGSYLAQLRGRGDDDLRAEALRMCDLMVAIHAVDAAVLPDSIDHPSDWNAYLDTLIAAWRETEQSLKGSTPMLRYMAAWLDENRPPEAPLGLVHGEFQPSNQVLGEDGELWAIDWEMSHIGDPREDIGWCKWVESVQPPVLIGLDDQAFCDRYCEQSGLGPEVVNQLSVGYFSVLPSMRVFAGVLAQQQAFADGENSSIRNGYLVGAVASAFEGWFGAARQLEAATHALATDQNEVPA
jgi:aminoglycoside phosphotransferase (APT) family kinase protein